MAARGSRQPLRIAAGSVDRASLSPINPASTAKGFPVNAPDAEKVPLPYALSLGLPGALSPLESPHRTPRRSPKSIDQGLRAVERRQPRLNIAQPSKVFLARLATQGQLGVFELLM